jgi:hypothetical protein
MICPGRSTREEDDGDLLFIIFNKTKIIYINNFSKPKNSKSIINILKYIFSKDNILTTYYYFIKWGFLIKLNPKL